MGRTHRTQRRRHDDDNPDMPLLRVHNAPNEQGLGGRVARDTNAHPCVYALRSRAQGQLTTGTQKAARPLSVAGGQ